jgi:hypothetical protein
MSARKRLPKLLPAEEGESASLSERIEEQRQRIFKAMAIVDCCRYASERMLAPTPRVPDVEAALAAAYEILQAATTVLEELTTAKANATERDTSLRRDSS